MKTTALIAEDEPLLAQALQAELAAVWPELEVLAVVGDGLRAVSETRRLLPQVLFFDIRMPGLDGLSAAAEIADLWPITLAPLPQLVFVTAYGEYAARAFEAQALDYVLKPVQPERLRRTVERLRRALQAPGAPIPSLETALAQLAQWRVLLEAAAPSPPVSQAATDEPLRIIAASDAGGSTVHMIPMREILYFQATDKYVCVFTAGHEYLIRTPLKQLIPRLPPGEFEQVHRSVLVRSEAIESAHRQEDGKFHLKLRGRAEKISVSRLYVQRFKSM
ncbi:MAG: LytTR family DNA-binding domain-containing protein [Burkholderiaceae bacterium]|jgi:DNA-binding LytR/AlgR family response regulator|nr:LytTR family DNA-binding domain-containing protein [Burkholderiaceae bacterium]